VNISFARVKLSPDANANAKKRLIISTIQIQSNKKKPLPLTQDRAMEKIKYLEKSK